MQINNGEWLKVLENTEFQKFMKTGNESFTKDQKLGFAVACLLTFIQDNFTGPDLESFRLKTFNNSEERWKIERISIDGIEVNANIRTVSLLVVSKNFLEDLAEQFPSDLVSLATCLYILT